MHVVISLLVARGSSADPRKQRVFAVVSRQTLIESKFSSVICAPVYSRHDGLATQVEVGIEEGLKHGSSVHCDELISVPKSKLTRFVGRLLIVQLMVLNNALKVALGVEDRDETIN